MDVITIDTFMIVDNIIVYTEKHHIHDQEKKYQKKQNNYFPTSIMKLPDFSCNFYHWTFNKDYSNRYSEVIFYKKNGYQPPHHIILRQNFPQNH